MKILKLVLSCALIIFGLHMIVNIDSDFIGWCSLISACFVFSSAFSAKPRVTRRRGGKSSNSSYDGSHSWWESDSSYSSNGGYSSGDSGGGGGGD